MAYKKLVNPLLTENYTRIEYDPEFTNHAPNNFIVKRQEDNKIIGMISFQEGPIKENGVNGVANEDLLGMVLTRLNYFQDSPFRCAENEEAIHLIERTLTVLRERTNKRIERNVEGTHHI